jgi:phosphopantothenoylcysteine decarboxylase/phosphopantothenate--cysteine ligase
MPAGPRLLRFPPRPYPQEPCRSPCPAPPDTRASAGKRILLIISGGIAAYKSLDLIRRLRERGAEVRPVMTAGAQEFVTPLAVGALAADHVYTDLFSREDEQDVGHIRLARDCDLICVAPATADLMAKMANGLAGDLASTVLLATNRPVLIAPAMNPAMWSHPATRRNVETLRKDGIRFIGPMAGEMAESNEAGEGRMAEPLQIVASIEALLDDAPKPLRQDRHRHLGPHARADRPGALHRQPLLRQAGPRHRRPSRPPWRRGDAGLRPGDDPRSRRRERRPRRERPRNARCRDQALPADIAVFVAAVADWRVSSLG